MGILFLAFLLSHGLNVIASILMIVALIRLHQNTGISLVHVMTLLFVTWGTTNLLLILPNIFPLQIRMIALLNVIGSAFAPALFILFADRFEGQVSPIKTAVATATPLLAIMTVVIALWTDNLSVATVVLPIETENLITMRWGEMPSLFLFPSILLTGVWVHQELNATILHAFDKRQLKQLKSMKIGNILTFFIGPIFGVVGVILVTIGHTILGTWSSEIVGYAIVSIGVFIFGINYLMSSETAFLKPQRVDTLLVLHQTGIPILRYDFRPPEIDADTALISGAITAITALMSETFGVKSSVKSIHFEDKELMLQFFDDIAFILITERTSVFLEKALEKLKIEFQDNFSKKYNFNSGEVLDQTIFIPTVRQCFGLQGNYS